MGKSRTTSRGKTGEAVQEFEGKLESMGPKGSWTCVRIPFNVEKTFGSRARVAVKGTLNGFSFRSSIFPMGDGTHFMMVNKAMQRGASVGPGEAARFSIERDTEPRTVEVPADLTRSLAERPEAGWRFEEMPYSHKKEYVEWIESAKRAETRARRIERALDMLSEGKRLKG